MRISKQEAIELFRLPLVELGRKSHAIKASLYSNRVTYVKSRQINPTNLCIYSCKFCDFAAKPKDSHAYLLGEAEILDLIEEPGLQEVHITGGVWPKWGFKKSLELVRSIRKKHHKIWIKAFTAVEVSYFSKTEEKTVSQVLTEMKDAGVNALAGGGAEVLSERIHGLLYKDKIDPKGWLEIHRKAHLVGLTTNCTLLFGHIESHEEIVEHLFLIRELQDITQGFQCFIPLAYQPGNTKLVDELVSAPECLRIIAIARIILDNVPHIKAYWPTLQLETASAALSFGADDLDGTLGEERIMQHAGTSAPKSIGIATLEKLAAHAGQIAIPRSGDFKILSSGE